MLEIICKSVSKCSKKCGEIYFETRERGLFSNFFNKKAKKCNEIVPETRNESGFFFKLCDNVFLQIGKKALLLQPYLMHLANNN
jgi:hypothetical protein